MPENTIPAMKNAIDLGVVTTLEMDTHVTADGQVIGRPVDDDTDFSLLKQGPQAAATHSVHSKEQQQ